jgi:hypothetical protein
MYDEGVSNFEDEILLRRIDCNIPNLINRGISIKRCLLMEFNWKYFYLMKIENYDLSGENGKLVIIEIKEW